MSDEQPMVHEIGNRTYLVADVEPLDLDGVRTMQVGTALWAVALLLLLPFRGELEARDATWWLWVCVAGFGLGLVGWDHCRRLRRRRVEQGDEGDLAD
ncbi:DUF2530 domain-containing protein [Nocardioides aequoreus]|uniref:DUF2530 domain-containing protein n=1 Tax=Nocardioides aequoreus TaxID=397278 RepID=UPI001FE18BCB|nr:DUF2530 domain-containing protein [Nocardioides aequoreus]